MKTEAEIRRVRDNLLALTTVPCTCRTLEGQYVCASIRNTATKEAELLSWLLGENPAFQGVVDGLEYAHRVIACPNN